MVAEVLGLEVALRGVEGVQRGLQSVNRDLQQTDNVARSAAVSMAALTTATALAAFGFAQAKEQQEFNAQIEGLTGSLAEMEKQLGNIDRISSKGVWGEDKAFEAVHALNLWGAATERNIKLAEQLGAKVRGPNGLQAAAELIGQIEGGMTFGLTRRLREFGIGPDALRAAGLDVKGREIKGSPEQIIQALVRLSETSKVYELRQKTLSATVARITYQFGEFWEKTMTPLLVGLTWLGNLIEPLVVWLRMLNDALGGAIGLVALFVLLAAALKYVPGGLWNLFRSVSRASIALDVLAAAAGRAAAAQAAGSAAGAASGAAGKAAAAAAGAAGGAAAGARAAAAAAGAGSGAAAGAAAGAGAAASIAQKIGHVIGWGGAAAKAGAIGAAPVVGGAAAVAAVGLGAVKLIEWLTNIPDDQSFFNWERTKKNFDRNTGWGWFGGNDKPKVSTPPAEKANRRDDIEKMMSRLRGKAWT